MKIDIYSGIFFLIILSVICIKCSVQKKITRFPFVIGIIEKIELSEIQNKAAGKAPRFETRIYLTIIENYNNKGERTDPENYDYPYFSGDSSLLNKFKYRQKVKIVCDSNTGRHIHSIELIE